MERNRTRGAPFISPSSRWGRHINTRVVIVAVLHAAGIGYSQLTGSFSGASLDPDVFCVSK